MLSLLTKTLQSKSSFLNEKKAFTQTTYESSHARLSVTTTRTPRVVAPTVLLSSSLVVGDRLAAPPRGDVDGLRNEPQRTHSQLVYLHNPRLMLTLLQFLALLLKMLDFLSRYCLTI